MFNKDAPKKVQAADTILTMAFESNTIKTQTYVCIFPIKQCGIGVLENVYNMPREKSTMVRVDDLPSLAPVMRIFVRSNWRFPKLAGLFYYGTTKTDRFEFYVHAEPNRGGIHMMDNKRILLTCAKTRQRVFVTDEHIIVNCRCPRFCPILRGQSDVCTNVCPLFSQRPVQPERP